MTQHRPKMVCLLTRRISLNDGIRDTLVMTACELIRDGGKKKTFMDENGTGEVFTKGDRASLASFSGIKFRAEVAFGKQEGIVQFILDDRETETILGADWDGEWSPYVPDSVI